jgi:hypothetical protein
MVNEADRCCEVGNWDEVELSSAPSSIVLHHHLLASRYTRL